MCDSRLLWGSTGPEAGPCTEPAHGDTEPGPPPGSDEEGPLKSRDEPKRGIKALREQVSKLIAAGLRATASLDVGTVLRDHFAP